MGVTGVYMNLGAPLGPDRRRLLGLGLGGHGALPFRRLSRGLRVGPDHEPPAQPVGRRREADAAADAAAAAGGGYASSQHEPRGGRRHVGARHGRELLAAGAELVWRGWGESEVYEQTAEGTVLSGLKLHGARIIPSRRAGRHGRFPPLACRHLAYLIRGMDSVRGATATPPQHCGMMLSWWDIAVTKYLLLLGWVIMVGRI